MFECRRSNADPLLRIMLKKYHLHVLQWPREGILPGDLVIEKPGLQTLRVPLSVVFKDAPEAFVRKGHAMADIEETFSGKLEAKNGVSLLEYLATSFGASSASLQTAYEKASKVVVRIRMSNWLDCDPSRLSAFVAAAEIRPDQGFFSEDDTLYVINGVGVAQSIEVIAYDSSGTEVSIKAKATGVGTAASGFKARGEGNASVVYEGERPLPFGVELVKLVSKAGSWKIEGVDRYVQLRGEEDRLPASASAFIGDADEGPAFLDLTDPSA